MFRALTLIIFLICTVAEARPISTIKADQEIVFFPSVARWLGEGKWELDIHGCVFEPDKRSAALFVLRGALVLNHIRLNEAENKIFTERARLFMVDHKGGRRIVVRIAGKDFDLGKSGVDGNFSAVLRLTDEDIRKLSDGFGFQAVLRAKDKRVFSGELCLCNETGVTVISDIDDTIKLTQVSDRRATLRHTFLEPFQPVPGMAEAYHGWAQQCGAQFFYVSASPWQLFSPLDAFLRTNGFPSGAFYLKKFRWKDESALSLFDSPEKYKPTIIEPLLQQFPKRNFVLVGDSGERDPEIYGVLAREHPDQIKRILIRDVTGEEAASERYKSAFRDLPPGLWKIFRDAAEIKDAVAATKQIAR
jgi:phosphatidate phosphatase APP1